jgi:DNA-binding response OmpR family regulator
MQRVSGEPATSGTVPPTLECATAASAVRNQLRVLVVDKSFELGDRIAALLERLGLNAILLVARDSLAAVQMFREHTPHAVVLDLDRTAQDGFALLLQMRTHAPACEIIMVTSDAEREVRAIAVRLGADHFFDKISGLHHVAAVVASLERAQRLAEPVSTDAI